MSDDFLHVSFGVISRETIFKCDTVLLSLRFDGHFPGEPGLVSFIGAKYNGSGGGN